MSPPRDPDGDFTIAELVRGQARIELALVELAKTLPTSYTTLTMWEMRNGEVDRRFEAQGREIADLRAEAKARRQPWTSVMAAIAALVALSITVVRAVAGG